MDNEHITDPSRITRRDLISLASISFPLLANIRQRHLTASIIEDFLSEATTSVTTCWHSLQRSDGLPIVEFTLPQYLPELVAVVQSSSLYRQRASYLAAQGFLLCSIVSYHRSRFPERVEHCQEAVSYADAAEDPTLLVASLEHLSDALRTNDQVAESFPTYLQAKQYSEKTEIAGFLRSRVRSGLSLVHAKQGESEAVVRFVDEASTTFTEADDETPVFLRANHGLCVIILREGLSTLDLGNHANDQGRPGRAQKYWMDAAEKLGKIEQLPSNVLVPARIAAEIEIARALAYAKARNMEGFITAFEKGARLAKELGSEKRKQEARDALHTALEQWPHDQRITGLWELLV